MKSRDRQNVNPFVCMVAFSDYLFDARIRREAETLASNGYRVLCLKTKNQAEPRRFVLNGVQVRELGISKYQGKSGLVYIVSYLYFLIRVSAVCLGLLLKGELDVVHVHNLPDFLVLAGLLPRLAGRKVVLDVHDSIPETFATKFSKSSLLRRVLCLEERLSAGIAHRVICVNEPQRDRLVARRIPASKTFVSMNVPDPAIFKRSSSNGQPSVTDGHFNLVYHGTMAERLGVDLIIRAVAEVRGRIPGVRLHLWGHGDDLRHFHTLAQQLEVSDRVLFNEAGFALEELPRQLRPMHLGLVGNRRSEAGDLMLPVKLLEYVALGIPVVVPRLRTIQHYFTEAMVAYYEPGDVVSFSDAIYRLFCHPEARRQQAERADGFMTAYGWERHGTELLTLYRELLETRTA